MQNPGLQRKQALATSALKSKNPRSSEVLQKRGRLFWSLSLFNTPKGTRTPVLAVRGLRPRPLDDGGLRLLVYIAAPPKSSWRTVVRVVAGDEAGGAVARDVIPHPLHQHQNAVVKLHQVHDVHEQPDQPGAEAGNAQPAEVGDGGAAADGRQVALVVVMERHQLLAAEAGLDEPGHVAALLHGHGGDAG